MDKQVLLEIFLQAHSLEPLVEAVAGALSCPVLVTDNGFHLVAAADPTGCEEPAYRQTLAHSVLPLPLCAAIARQGDGDDAVPTVLGERPAQVRQLYSGGAALGYILYLPPAGALPADPALSLAEQLIAKQFYCEKHAGGAAADTAEEILTDLLDGKFPDEERFRRRVAGTYLAHFRPERLALLTPPAAETLTRREALPQQFSREFQASLSFFYRGQLAVLLHADHDLQQLEAVARRGQLTVAVSGRLPTLYSVAALYPAVADTLAYYRRRDGAPGLIRCEDYALLMLLRRAQGRYMEGDIRPLYEHDRDTGGALCLTYYTYLICGRSLQATGERLFTHRNTIQYRLHKLREEYGIDTQSPERFTAHLLSLALALVQLGQEQPFLPPPPEEAGSI